LKKLIYICVIFISMISAQEAFPADVAGTGTRSPEEGKHNLGMGWKYFDDENYKFAISAFSIAARYPETSLDARFGLGLSHMKLEDKQKASEEFIYLVDNGHKVDEVLPPLMWILIEKKDYMKARKYLRLSKDAELRNQWRAMISTGTFSSRAEPAIESRDTDMIMSAVDDNRRLLSSCTAPYIFFNSARVLSEEGFSDEAVMVYSDILKYCTGDLDLRALALGELSRHEAPGRTMQRLNEERDSEKNREYEGKLDAIETSVLMRMLEKVEPSSEESLELVKRINALKPEDDGMLARLSWDSLNLKKFERAHDGFSRLRVKHPESTEYALGLAYTLIALGRNAEALSITDQFRDREDEFRRISLNAHAGIGRQAYQRRDYKSALEHYNILLEAEPYNEEALSLSAWSHYNAGNYLKALPYFVKNYNKTQDPAFVMPILSIFESTNKKKAQAFISDLSGSGRPEAVKALADYYSAKGRNITAAQVTEESTDSCYYNADRPWVDAGFSVRDKSGDSGLSKLNEQISNLSIHYPVSGGRELALSVRHIALDSGTPPALAFAGRFNPGTPQPWGITNSVSLIEPELRYRKEGTVNYSLALGGSPGGGEAPVSPTFSFEAKSSQWMLELHRSPVRESILSYSGLKDPYGPSWWGGVLRSGIKGALGSNPSGRYVFYFEAGYDKYAGENVIDNDAYNATISIGRPISGTRTNIVIGGFITAMGFDIDSNHFTYGHGGYFSPQSFMAVGPSLRITSKHCRTLWFDLQASVSYMDHETDRSPHYPLDTGIQNTYEEGSFSGTGFSLRGEARKLLSTRWSAGISLGIDNSSEYDQWQAGLGLRYLAGGRGAVMP
jgi:tetratricopeptide (TPR) repeat protein